MEGDILVFETATLTEALGLGEKEHIALVGAGGKSTLMLTLAGLLQRRGKRVLLTTTTKVSQEQARKAPLCVFTTKEQDWQKRCFEGLDRHGVVFLAKALHGSTKVAGIDPGLADELFGSQHIDFVMVEADGAAGRPLKVPGPNEPVIPASTTLVVGMAGAEALEGRVDEALVFRVEEFLKVTGAARGQKITTRLSALVFVKGEGIFKHTPPRARKVAFLNKIDLLPGEASAHEWAERVLVLSDDIERAIFGSIKQDKFYLHERGHGGTL